MPTSSRIYQCLEKFDINKLYKRLQTNSEKTFKVNNPETGGIVNLQTTIEDLRKIEEKKIIRGLLKYDFGQEFKQRSGKIKFFVSTKEIPFSFFMGSIYFIPFASGSEADFTTSRISSTAFGDMKDPILTCNITAPKIEDFLTKNAHEITNCWWKNVRIPNLSRAGLSGTGIDNTSDFKRYDKFGDKGTIRLRLLKNGWSVLINQHASVVFYSNISRDDVEDFLKKEIIPRCN